MRSHDRTPDATPRQPASKSQDADTHTNEQPEVPAGSEVTVDGILAHSGFVRALARGLLRDEAEVEDVVQETLTRALENGPRRREALSAWLRSVVRNIVFKGHRGRARRARREADAARAEALPGVGELFVRDAALRDLTDAVLDLPEQAREAVLLRYYEGLSPQAIGARLGLPPGTVRMRLHRALVALRRRLDAEADGDRQQWMRGLALLAGVPPEAAGAPDWTASAEAAQGTSGVSGSMVAGALVLVAVAVVGVFIGVHGSSDAAHDGALVGLDARDAVASTPSVAPDRRPAGAPTGAAADEGSASPGRLDAAALAKGHEAAATESRPLTGAVARGRVVGADGVGVPGATVLGAWGTSELIRRGTTAVDGTFELPIRLGPEAPGGELPLLLAATSEGHAPSGVLAVAHQSGTPEAPITLCLRGPDARCELRVVDGSGAPVAGALVTLGERLRFGLGLLGPLRADEENPLAPLLAARFDAGERAAFPGHPGLRGSLGALLLTRDGALTRQLPAQRMTTGKDGRATFVGLEPGSAQVHVSANGFAARRTQLALATGQNVHELMLERGARVVGRVQRADGLALGRALVHMIDMASLDLRSVAVAKDGRFVLEGLPEGRVRVVAERQHEDHVVERAERTLDLTRGMRRELVLELAPLETLLVRVTAGGAPLVGWRVEARGLQNPVALLERAVTDARGLARIARSQLLPAELWVVPADPTWTLPVRVTAAPFEAPPRVPAAESADLELGRAPRAAVFSIDLSVDEVAGAYVSGRLLGPDGAPAPEGSWLQLSCVQRSDSSGGAPGRIGLPGQVRDGSGAFEIGPLPLGTYRLNAPYLGLGTLVADPIVVAGPGRMDLGIVRLPDRAVVSLAANDGAPRCADLRVTQLLAGVAGEERFVLFDGRAELPVMLALGPGLFEFELAGEPARRASLASGAQLSLTCR